MEIIKKAAELIETNKTFVLATIVDSVGSSPGKTGFKQIILPDKQSFGTIGGGAIEERVKEDAIDFLNKGKNGLKEYLLNADKQLIDNVKEVVPMMCNGTVKIYYEVYGMAPTVYVFGGGHVGQAVTKLLGDLGYYIVLVDNRLEYADKEKNPFTHKIVHSDYEKYADEFIPDENSYLLVLTHGHKYDYSILEKIYKRNLNVKYIGAIASKNKAQKMKQELKEVLGGNIDLSKLHSPVGLKIGGDSAAEIAVSIVAEMQSVRYSKNGLD